MAFQHITCRSGRSSARHLRDLRCSPPLLGRLYRPIALYFDTLHVRRRPLLVQKRHILCRPVSCKFSCFARQQHEPVRRRIRHLSIPSYLPIPLIDIEVLILDRFASGDPTHKVFIIAKLSFILFLTVPRDLQVVLAVNRRRRYGIYPTPPSHSRYVYLISIVICTVCN